MDNDFLTRPNLTKTCVYPVPCSPPKTSHLLNNLATLASWIQCKFAVSRCRFSAPVMAPCFTSLSYKTARSSKFAVLVAQDCRAGSVRYGFGKAVNRYEQRLNISNQISTIHQNPFFNPNKPLSYAFSWLHIEMVRTMNWNKYSLKKFRSVPSFCESAPHAPWGIRYNHHGIFRVK
jgi:hypothetical protein